MNRKTLGTLFVCFILLGGMTILVDPETGQQTPAYDYGNGVVQGQDGQFRQYNSPVIEPYDSLRVSPYTYRAPDQYDPYEMEREREREKYWQMIEEIKRRKF